MMAQCLSQEIFGKRYAMMINVVTLIAVTDCSRSRETRIGIDLRIDLGEEISIYWSFYQE